MKYKSIFALLIMIAAIYGKAYSNAGQLDLTFNSTGYVRFGFGAGTDTGKAVALQPDGKIVVAATTTEGSRTGISVLRYLPDGSYDTSFNGAGKLFFLLGTSDSTAAGVAIQADGKIVVAGTTRLGPNAAFAVIRFNSDGSKDTSFGSNGVVTTDFGPDSGDSAAVLIQPDQKIVVAGSVRPGIGVWGPGLLAAARYNPDGSLDTSFNGTGKVTTGPGWATSAALQTDGKLVVAGSCVIDVQVYNFCAARFDSNGALDTSFTGGLVIAPGTRTAQGVAVQPDGKIVMVGFTYNGGGFTFVRYNANGSHDNTFDGDGKVLLDFADGYNDISRAQSVHIQPDGKILALGLARPPGVPGTNLAGMRLNPDGSLDPTFNGTGKFHLSVTGGYDGSNASVLTPGGKIILAGNGSGSETATAEGSDEILVSKFNPDGTIDPAFGTNGAVLSNVGEYQASMYTMAIQPNGKIVTGGYPNMTGPRIARFNPDGSPDTSLNGSGKIFLKQWRFFDLDGIAVQPDEKILVAGTNYSWTTMVGRINPDGTTDNSFGTEGSTQLATFVISSIALQSDGKILLSGNTPIGRGLTVARLNADGTLDRTFGRDGKFTAVIGEQGGHSTAMVVQPDGKILCTGQVTIAGKYELMVLRLESSGNLDSSFGVFGITISHLTQGTDSPTSIALHTDGKIAVAGFTSLGNGLDDRNFLVARYNGDGSLDTTFNGTGMNTVHLGGEAVANGVAFQADGKIIAAGYRRATDNDFAAVRFTTAGVLDEAGWGNQGVAILDILGHDYGSAMALDSFGRLTIAGGICGLSAVVRLTSDSAPVSFATVSGRVLDANGQPVARATVTMTGPDGVVRTAQANPFGNYSFEGVRTGETYTFKAMAKRLRFTPRDVMIGGDLSGLDLIANP